MNPSDKRLIAIWLVMCCLLVFSMIVLGGVTRLTQSGLSMVDWDPIMGAIPPLNEREWQEAFEQYQGFPEYQVVNKDMSLAGFKAIFYVEYSHRVLGRSIGVVFFLPFLFFLFSGRLNRSLVIKLSMIFLLGGAQGLMGWYMVKSGLIDVPRVSPYRLTAHLMLAVLIFGSMMWLLLDLWRQEGKSRSMPVAFRRFAGLVLFIVTAMIFTGGFVAGTRAGFTFNTFPKMYDRWIPEGLWTMQPAWSNLFENVATVQFVHRCLALLLTLLISGLWIASRHSGDDRTRRACSLLLVTLAIQITLGITTLIYSVPVALAAAHQGGALVVFGIALAIYHGKKRGQIPFS
jgi:cytochrome c oxidase assembly protein subunit 15